jgi:hypothetical protein
LLSDEFESLPAFKRYADRPTKHLAGRPAPVAKSPRAGYLSAKNRRIAARPARMKTPVLVEHSILVQQDRDMLHGGRCALYERPAPRSNTDAVGHAGTGRTGPRSNLPGDLTNFG